MKRKIIIFTFLLSGLFTSVSANNLSALHASCQFADPITSSNFCKSFKAVAECHCTSAGWPSTTCKDMNALYKLMIDTFKSQQKACEWQKDVDPKLCMDDWDCYRSGKDSHGNACSGTGGAACQ
jgi:hypothetical protein